MFTTCGFQSAVYVMYKSCTCHTTPVHAHVTPHQYMLSRYSRILYNTHQHCFRLSSTRIRRLHEFKLSSFSEIQWNLLFREEINVRTHCILTIIAIFSQKMLFLPFPLAMYINGCVASDLGITNYYVINSSMNTIIKTHIVTTDNTAMGYEVLRAVHRRTSVLSVYVCVCAHTCTRLSTRVT